MQYHHNARTNVNQRQAIKTSSESTRVLGKTYKISNVTAAKWKNANHTGALLFTDNFNRLLIDWLDWYNTRRVHCAFGNKLSPLQFAMSLKVRELTQMPQECKSGWTHTNLTQNFGFDRIRLTYRAISEYRIPKIMETIAEQSENIVGDTKNTSLIRLAIFFQIQLLGRFDKRHCQKT